MSNKKQNHIGDTNKMVSSVEWLISQLQRSKDWHRVLNEISQMSSARVDIIEQAKAMEKEQMIEHSFNFYYDLSNKKDVPFNLISENRILAEQYYNETYGS